MKIEKPGFADYVNQVGELTGIDASTARGFFEALDKRMEFLNPMGCRAADHGVDYVYCTRVSDRALEEIFKKGISGKALGALEVEEYKSMILIHLA